MRLPCFVSRRKGVALLPFPFALFFLEFCFARLFDEFRRGFHQYFFFHLEQLAAFADVYRTHNGVGYHRDTLHDARNQSGTLDGVFPGFFQQQVGLEADKIHLVGVDIGLVIRSVVLAGEAVGVIAVGQEADFDVHAFL